MSSQKIFNPTPDKSKRKAKPSFMSSSASGSSAGADSSPQINPVYVGIAAGIAFVLIACLATVQIIGPSRICGSVLFFFGLGFFIVNWINEWLPEGCVPGCVRGVFLLSFIAGLILLVGGDHTVDLIRDVLKPLQ